MTFTNKILTYLGFCPSRESAQSFKKNNKPFVTHRQKWKSYYNFMTYTGIILTFTGLVPFYFEDTTISGVTDTIILHGKIGVTCFFFGVILIIFGAIIPRIINKIRMIGV